MTSRAAAEAALLLPLRLHSAPLRLRFFCTSASRLRWACSAAALLAVVSLVTAICAMPDAGAGTNVEADAGALRLEIEALRLKVARLGEAPSPILSVQFCLLLSSQNECQSGLAGSWKFCCTSTRSNGLR
jgi:hypothetical protein